MIFLSKTERNGFLLDFGAGDCGRKDTVKNLGYRYIGIDIKYHQDLSVVCDGHFLPFKDEVFDSCITYAVFEHLNNPFIVIKELRRAIKTGGELSGSVAFLEAFHDSFFHITHLGLKELLEKSGFRLLEMIPGNHCIQSLGSSLLNLYIINRITIIPYLVMKLRLLFAKLIVLKRRLLKQKVDLKSVQKFLEVEPFRFAGAIFFKAIKQ
jgi:SAM-dependent methyltransferase